MIKFTGNDLETIELTDNELYALYELDGMGYKKNKPPVLIKNKETAKRMYKNDTCFQELWLVIIKELGGKKYIPIECVDIIQPTQKDLDNEILEKENKVKEQIKQKLIGILTPEELQIIFK